jgi:hypothetical protein
MTSRDRVTATLNFQKADRLPIIEWAPYWTLTIERWRKEGLPAALHEETEFRDYFGLDPMAQLWVGTHTPDVPWEKYDTPLVRTTEDYDRVRTLLYRDTVLDMAGLEKLSRFQENGGAIWITFPGFFWHPRTLFGIEEHLYSFYDHADLMNRMNEDLLEFIYRQTERICEYVSPQFATLAEDMSYNHGPMISKALFDESQSPFLKKVFPYLKSKGIKVFVDSDGLIDEPLDWYQEVGCEGFLPLEKQAGVDLVKLRSKHPDFLFIGAFDKTCMHKGEDAMRAEFERLSPVMAQGGYIPGVDHQTPPEVSLDDYRLYLKLLREYCGKYHPTG